MEAKKVREVCQDIFDGIDAWTDDLEDATRPSPTLGLVIDEIIEGEKRLQPVLESIPKEHGHDVTEIYNIYFASFRIGFAIGFVGGQMFDLVKPRSIKAIEVLKKELKAREAFPLFPREKKAA